MAKDTIASPSDVKYKFKRAKSHVFTILNAQKKEVGAARIEPNKIGWRPAGETRWYRMPIDDFAKWIVQKGATGEAD